jgi:tryptophanyl-tRNA synthetase
MSLVEPDKKMSKSEDESGCILLSDSNDAIMKKFKRAVTDSEMCVRYDPENKAGISNLMAIYSTITGKSFAKIEEEFSGKGYGVFKTAVGETVCAALSPIREKAEDLLKNKDYLADVYGKGAKKASAIAAETLKKVYDKIGFIKKPPLC